MKPSSTPWECQEFAEQHMQRTGHSVQWNKNRWSCNSCGVGKPKKKEDDRDCGNYYDNFVDGKGT